MIPVVMGNKAEMGKISNLITDMTLSSATNEVTLKQSVIPIVVIDAEKHDLDYKESASEAAHG